MGIYIPKMTMTSKRNGAVIIIYPNGTAVYEDGKEYQVVELPPHGDLIDRSMMLNTVSNRMFEFSKGHEEEYDFWARVYDFIVNAPIVVESEE